MNVENKRIDTSEHLIKIHSKDGNWNYDPYMHGLLNGMKLIHSVYTDKEYEPYDAPKQWKYRRWYNKIIDKITGKNKVSCEKQSTSK
jgi:hypothetical protein